MIKTFTLDDVLHPKGKPTTAHRHLASFYFDKLQPVRPPSILEMIVKAPSPFSVDTIIKDTLMFIRPTGKALERIQRAALARKAELKGEIFIWTT